MIMLAVAALMKFTLFAYTCVSSGALSLPESVGCSTTSHDSPKAEEPMGAAGGGEGAAAAAVAPWDADAGTASLDVDADMMLAGSGCSVVLVPAAAEEPLEGGVGGAASSHRL